MNNLSLSKKIGIFKKSNLIILKLNILYAFNTNSAFFDVAQKLLVDLRTPFCFQLTRLGRHCALAPSASRGGLLEDYLAFAFVCLKYCSGRQNFQKFFLLKTFFNHFVFFTRPCIDIYFTITTSFCPRHFEVTSNCSINSFNLNLSKSQA